MAFMVGAESQCFSRLRFRDLFLTRADAYCAVKRTFWGPLFKGHSLSDSTSRQTHLRSECFWRN